MKKTKSLFRNIQLEDILKMKQSTVKRYVSKQLNKLGYEKVIEEDGYVYAEGTYPVLLVAHMDTVHKETVKKIKYDDYVISSPQGIGGDDRCGIYIILEMLKDFKCSVVFTEDEEIGCIGASKFADSQYIDDCKVNYIVEFDRRGSKDAVFYSCDNKDFTEFIEEPGYFKKAWGSYSDICEIAPALGVAAVNLSSGYHNEHTLRETINLLEVQQTIAETKKILLQKVDAPFEYIEKKSSSWNNWYDDDDYYFGEVFTEEYSTLNYNGCETLMSKANGRKHIYHIYVTTYSGSSVCYELFAINKMEAIGIFLSKYSFYNAQDISDIIESCYETEEAAD